VSSPQLQSIPSSGPAREALRQKGQFWTPAWLARAMAAWVVKDHPPSLFDPAVGPGTFFAAAKEAGFRGSFAGFELDESVLAEGFRLGLPSSELAHVILGDFIASRMPGALPAVISNPPYIRHHRLTEARKQELRALALQCLGFPLDGRVGLHFYFLLKCLEHLAPGGRLAFLVPADVCEGVSSAAAWRRLAERFRIDAVLTFADAAAPFPNVDTNALVLLMSRRDPTDRVRWLRVLEPDPDAIAEALQSDGDDGEGSGSVELQWRTLEELLGTGLSRRPRPLGSQGVPLSHFARVVRGIATGANEFFFLTRARLRELRLDERYFQRALGRTRDCASDTLTPALVDQLDRAARPTWLLRLGKEPKEKLPAALRAYLEHGEGLGLPERPLIKTRKPWYRMEQRSAPPLLFAYLGRRDCRFILNRAGVVPLTCFLCVYPWDGDRASVERLWLAVNHPDTLANLVFVAKSYGGGALKVEPRQLEMLEIPLHVLREFGIQRPEARTQLALLEAPVQPQPIRCGRTSANPGQRGSRNGARSPR
jgi:adenine-specific DNA-methyltransferase